MKSRILKLITLLTYGIFIFVFIGCAMQSPKGLKYYPQNKDELMNLARDNNINLADIDTSAITDMSFLFANIPQNDCNEFESKYKANKEETIDIVANGNEKKMSHHEAINLIESILKACKYPPREDFSGIESWDTSNARDMRYMFSGTKSFNQNINSWNVSNVKDMEGMFADAESFNQPLDKWNVSNVKDMRRMFQGAKSFNQPLDKWDTSNVENMNWMFDNAKSFNQNLESWGDKIKKDCDTYDMFESSPLESNPPKWYKERTGQ